MSKPSLTVRAVSIFCRHNPRTVIVSDSRGTSHVSCHFVVLLSLSGGLPMPDRICSLSPYDSGGSLSLVT